MTRWIVKHRLILIAALIVTVPLVLHAVLPPREPPPEPITSMSLNMSLVNYADEGLDASINGHWVGGMGAHWGGASGMCCMGLPVTWHPDMTVQVTYQTDTMFRRDREIYKTVTVPVQPYNDPFADYIWLLYLPGDKFRVYVSGYGPGHPKFPDGLTWPNGPEDQPPVFPDDPPTSRTSP